MNKNLISFIVFIGISIGYMVNAQQREDIIVGTIHRPPFVFVEAIGDHDMRYRGFTVDLMNEIAQRANFNVTYVAFDQFHQMLDAVVDGDVSMAAANISVTAEREKVLDFTQPIYDGGLQILTRQNKSISLWKLFIESGVVKFVVLAVAVLLIIAHLLWFFERNVSDRRHDYFRDDYFGGVWDAFWWAFIIMTMGGFENEVPHKKISRFLAMTWIIVSLFFISTLTAKITTALTVNSLTTEINSYEDLFNKKLGIAKGTTMETFAISQGLPYIPYDDFALSLQALRNGDIEAVIGDAPIVQYYATHEGQGDVQVVGNIFAPDKLALALPQQSGYVERINYALLTIREDGTYEKIHKKWFGE